MSSPATAGLSGANQTLFDTYKVHFTAPTWVGWHQNDTCTSTPPAGSLALFNAITSTDKVQASFTGGHAVAADPCNGIAEASFAGIESTVAAAMVSFVKARSGLVAIPNQATPAPKPTPLPAAPPLANWHSAATMP